jgi:DivIVA domain-containing protein
MEMAKQTWYRKLTDSAAAPLTGSRESGEPRLTPEAVRRQRFTTTRLMTGYSVDEVDAFLDRVMDEMARLIRERDEARGEALDAARDEARDEARGEARDAVRPAEPGDGRRA